MPATVPGLVRRGPAALRGGATSRTTGAARARALVLLALAPGAVSPAVAGENTAENTIALPAPDLAGHMPVEQAIEQRRSERRYGDRPLSLQHLSQLLWAAQGITGPDGGRAAPSAGALYPLELYVVAGDVDSLTPGVYRYAPERHELIKHAGDDRHNGHNRREALAAAALGQSWVRRAPAVLVLAGVYERSAAKYGSRARRYTHMEAGHAAQNVYLQATAVKLATVIVGAFDDEAVRETLGLPADHAPLGLMPVGHPR